MKWFCWGHFSWVAKRNRLCHYVQVLKNRNCHVFLGSQLHWPSFLRYLANNGSVKNGRISNSRCLFQQISRHEHHWTMTIRLWEKEYFRKLGSLCGGFNHLLFLALLTWGNDPIWRLRLHIFERGWFNHQLEAALFLFGINHIVSILWRRVAMLMETNSFQVTSIGLNN